MIDNLKAQIKGTENYEERDDEEWSLKFVFVG